MADGGGNTLVADATVHTSGINWESLITVVCSVVLATSVIVGGFIRWQSRTVTNAVNGLADKLVERLETKENVAKLSREVGELRIRIEDIGHRT